MCVTSQNTSIMHDICVMCYQAKGLAQCKASQIWCWHELQDVTTLLYTNYHYWVCSRWYPYIPNKVPIHQLFCDLKLNDICLRRRAVSEPRLQISWDELCHYYSSYAWQRQLTTTPKQPQTTMWSAQLSLDKRVWPATVCCQPLTGTYLILVH